jgi:hypothetical protein
MSWGDLGQKSPSFLGAQNCLIARRLIERGSRFVQLYHPNWNSHGENLLSARASAEVATGFINGDEPFV